jgi:hypothetical protein
MESGPLSSPEGWRVPLHPSQSYDVLPGRDLRGGHRKWPKLFRAAGLPARAGERARVTPEGIWRETDGDRDCSEYKNHKIS